MEPALFVLVRLVIDRLHRIGPIALWRHEIAAHQVKADAANEVHLVTLIALDDLVSATVPECLRRAELDADEGLTADDVRDYVVIILSLAPRHAVRLLVLQSQPDSFF